MDDRGVRPRGRIRPPQPGDPRGATCQRPLQRLDLARRATAVGVVLPLVGLGVGEGVDDSQVEPELLTQALGEPFGLGEQVAGVEEHDLGVGDRLADEVNEDGIAEAGGGEQAVTEVVAGPAQDVERVGVLERCRHLTEVNDVHVGAHGSSLAQIPSNPIKNVQISIGYRSEPMAARFAYPVALDLHGVDVLVVGGGPVAARKVAGLAGAGAVVRVVAPEVSAAMEGEVDAGHVEVLSRRPFQPSDLDGVRLVITATGTVADHEVAAAATAAGIWVNAADRPVDCSFILPAVVRNGSVSIAVSTDGTSPALAQRLRDEAAGMLTDDVAALADRLAGQRASIKEQGGSTEQHDWSSEIDAVLGGPPTTRTVR